MSQVINANLIVDSTPHVIAATPTNRGYFNAAFLIRDERVPIDTQTALVFTSAAAVGAYFGLSSNEYAYSQVYFAGFDDSTIKPSYLYFARQADTAAAAWIRGGSLASMTLAQLQALSGTLTLTIDAETQTTASINLSAATSFSNAATIIDTALNLAFTAVVSCTFDSILSEFVITSGTTGATSIVSYATGTLAAGIKLTTATGAIRSLGTAAEAASAALVRLSQVALNWTTFTTIFATLDAERLELATWADSSKDYRFVCWDDNAGQVTSGDTTSFAVLMNGVKDTNGNYTTEPTYTLNYTIVLYNSITIAAALCGFCAAINVDPARSGKWVNLAFLTQTGLNPTLYNTEEARILISKGVSFYGKFATPAQEHPMFYNGKESGIFNWLSDSLADKKLRADVAEAFIDFAQLRKNLPFNPETYQAIEAYMSSSVFEPNLTIGLLNKNVALDAGQILQVNSTFDSDKAAQNVMDNGYLFKMVPATSAQRAERKGTAIYAYTTGGSIQSLVIDSYAVQ